MDVHFAHGDQTGFQIRLPFRIRLMDNPFVAHPGGTGFVRVDAGNQDQFVLHFFLNSGQPCYIVQDSILVVCRTGTDDDQKFIGFSGEYLPDHGIPLFFSFPHGFRNRNQRLHLFR